MLRLSWKGTYLIALLCKNNSRELWKNDVKEIVLLRNSLCQFGLNVNVLDKKFEFAMMNCSLYLLSLAVCLDCGNF